MAYLYDNGFTVETLSDVFFDITTASYCLSYSYPNLNRNWDADNSANNNTDS